MDSWPATGAVGFRALNLPSSNFQLLGVSVPQPIGGDDVLRPARSGGFSRPYLDQWVPAGHGPSTRPVKAPGSLIWKGQFSSCWSLFGPAAALARAGLDNEPPTVSLSWDAGEAGLGRYRIGQQLGWRPLAELVESEWPRVGSGGAGHSERPPTRAAVAGLAWTTASCSCACHPGS